jgi:hypothetical protein
MSDVIDTPAPEAKSVESPAPEVKPVEAPPAEGQEPDKKVEEKKPEPEPKPNLMARLLAKEEKRKAEIETLKKERAELEKLRSLESVKPLADKYQAIEKAKAEGDIAAILETLGLDLSTINESFLSGKGKAQPSVQDEIKKALEEREAAQKQAQAAAYKAQEEQAKANIVARVGSLDSLELTNALGHQQDVYDLMRVTYEETGKLLTVEEAGQQVEEFLEQSFAKKQAKRNPPPAPAPAEEKKPENTESPKSVSNTMAASSDSISVEEMLKKMGFTEP